MADIPANERAAARNDIDRVPTEMRVVGENGAAPEATKKRAKLYEKDLTTGIQFAPWWVRVLSALCLGLGTMIGYKRIVKTLGERIGSRHLVPAQGGAAEIVAAVLIGGAGVTGFPVSTTHVVMAGIAGTMDGRRRLGRPAEDPVADRDGVDPDAAGDDRAFRRPVLSFVLSPPSCPEPAAPLRSANGRPKRKRSPALPRTTQVKGGNAQGGRSKRKRCRPVFYCTAHSGTQRDIWHGSYASRVCRVSK